MIDSLLDVCGIGAQIHSERPIGARLHLSYGGFHLLKGHCGRRQDAQPPALAVPVTNDGPATHPIPVCTIG